MPQLDVATFPSQLFWLFICFGITYLALKFWLIPRIERIQSMRELKIERSFEKAKSCQKQTAFLIKDYEDILKEAKDQATEIIISTHKKNQTERLELEHEINGWLKEELKIIEQKLDREKEINEDDIKEAVEEITSVIVEQLKQHQKSVDLTQIIEKKVIHG